MKITEQKQAILYYATPAAQMEDVTIFDKEGTLLFYKIYLLW